MRSLTLAVIGLFLAASPALAINPTPTSGPIVPNEWPPTSDAAVLYDQMDNAGTNATASQNFEPANDAFDCFLGDDFIVPAAGWIVQLVEINGLYFNGTGPAASVNVWIYSNSGANLPGAPVFTQLNSAYSSPSPGDFAINLSPAPCLPPGHYWLVIQPNMNFAGGLGQWGWNDRTVTSNAPAAWQNPGGGFGTPCNAWGYRGPNCGIDPAAPDQNFRLSGTVGCGANNCTYPPAGLDTFDSWATVIVELDNPPISMNVMVEGPTTIRRGTPMPVGNLQIIDTEMLSMDLTGISCLGPLHVRESPSRPSLGRVSQIDPANCYPADSFFDVFLEVTVNGMTLHNNDPIHMNADNRIHSLPPYDDEYRSPFLIILYNQNGQPVGRIIDVSHIPHPPHDCFFSTAVLTTSFGTFSVTGPVDVLRDAPLWNGSSWETETEILMMDLRGQSPQGPVILRESPTLPSHGRINGPDFNIPPQADSFFDVFVEVELPAVGRRACNQQPFHMTARINSLPPTGAQYQLVNGPIQMFDCQTFQPMFQVNSVIHRPDTPFDWTPPPPPGRDCFCSTATVVVDLGQGPITIDNLFGPTDIRRDQPVQIPDGRFQIQTEMLALNLHSNVTPIGPVDVRESPSRPSMGLIQQQQVGPLFPADSFFDVFVEIQPQGGPVLHNEQPIRMSSVIHHIPPDDDYQGNNPVQLFDQNGVPRGVLLQEIHRPGDPFDWQNCPFTLVCPDPAAGGIEQPQPAPAVIAATHLYPGIPNPFSGSTSIAFDVKAGGTTRLRVYDIAGRLVKTLVDEGIPAQTHREVTWDGTDQAGKSVTAGIYFARLDAEGQTLTRKLILLR